MASCSTALGDKFSGAGLQPAQCQTCRLVQNGKSGAGQVLRRQPQSAAHALQVRQSAQRRIHKSHLESSTDPIFELWWVRRMAEQTAGVICELTVSQSPVWMVAPEHTFCA